MSGGRDVSLMIEQLAFWLTIQEAPRSLGRATLHSFTSKKFLRRHLLFFGHSHSPLPGEHYFLGVSTFLRPLLLWFGVTAQVFIFILTTRLIAVILTPSISAIFL